MEMLLFLLQTDATPTASSNLPLWIAVVTSLGAILVAIVTGYYNFRTNKDLFKANTDLEKLKEETKKFKEEVQLTFNGLELKVSLETWSKITDLCALMFEKTSVERILFLRGWNGSNAMTHATAVHQIRSKNSVRQDYIFYPVGEEYNYFLSKAKEQLNFIKVSDLDVTSEVKQIYLGEEPPITESGWLQLNRTDSHKGKVLVEYMSISTFNTNGFTVNERNFIRRIAFEIKGLLQEENVKNDSID